MQALVGSLADVCPSVRLAAQSSLCYLGHRQPLPVLRVLLHRAQHSPAVCFIIHYYYYFILFIILFYLFILFLFFPKALARRSTALPCVQLSIIIIFLLH